MNKENILDKLSELCVTYSGRIVASIAVLIVGSILIRLVMKSFLTGKAGKKLDPSVVAYGRMLLRIVLKLIIAVSVIAILGIPMASVVTVIAAIGAAIALALQGSLANIASGVILMLTHPYRLNDWIIVGDKEGTVVDFGLFFTTIRTIENTNVVIPNNELTSSVIINCTSERLRRTNFTVSAAYGSDPDTVRRVILEYAATNEKIASEPEPFVKMCKMGDSSIDFIVRFYAKTEDYWDVYFESHEGIYKAFRENGVEIPFDQVDVHIKN